MTRRLLTIISGQPLPNYIALAETATRPDVVHCLYTPAQSGMAQRLEALQRLCQKHFPQVEFQPIAVDDAYDSSAVWKLGYKLLTDHKSDQWLLNRTAGTEQMRAPLAEAFRLLGNQGDFRSFFVETEKSQTTFVDNAWLQKSEPFRGDISVGDYFSLHGHQPERKDQDFNNRAEHELHKALDKLAFHNLMPSCGLKFRGGPQFDVAYDEAGTYQYRLLVFERKHWLLETFPRIGGLSKGVKKSKEDGIQHDLEKLAYTRAIFGGPFGSVYWVLSGTYKWPAGLQARCEALGVRLITGYDNLLVKQQKSLGLPPKRPG